MSRFGNAKSIADIEFVIDAPGAGSSIVRWVAFGATCVRERHRFDGDLYSYTFDVTRLKHPGPKAAWQAIIVSEWWRLGETPIRRSQWLKMISGRSVDMQSWMRRARAEKTQG